MKPVGGSNEVKKRRDLTDTIVSVLRHESRVRTSIVLYTPTVDIICATKTSSTRLQCAH